MLHPDLPGELGGPPGIRTQLRRVPVGSPRRRNQCGPGGGSGPDSPTWLLLHEHISPCLKRQGALQRLCLWQVTLPSPALPRRRFRLGGQLFYSAACHRAVYVDRLGLEPSFRGIRSTVIRSYAVGPRVVKVAEAGRILTDTALLIIFAPARSGEPRHNY